MSFSPAQNYSSIPDSSRSSEDSHWRSKHVNGHANGHTEAGVGTKLREIFSEQQDLPMYKDKPHFPAGRKGANLSPRYYGLLVLLVLALFWWFSSLGSLLSSNHGTVGRSPSWLPDRPADWDSRREAVRAAFVTSWDGYEEYAWGMDEYMPIAKKGKNMVPGGMGWMILDALDTAIMMNLTSRVKHAREWMKTSLHFDADHEVNTFETTIRLLGGLLSAHYLSTTYPHLAPQVDDDINQPGEDLYLELATDLGDRLLGAFDTQTGIPYSSVNLNTSVGFLAHIDGGASSTAEAASLQLEFKYLSKLTGEPIYWEKAERVIQMIEANQRLDGLVPIHIYSSTGEFRGQNIRLGSRGDSYYEYLIKQYLQTSESEPVYLSMWEEALEGIKKHLVVYSKTTGLTVLGERPVGIKNSLKPKMDHLVCFLPGSIALAVTGGSTVADAKLRLGEKWTEKEEESLRLAEELTQTCWSMYKATKTGLAPEIAHFKIDDPPRMWMDWERDSNSKKDFDKSADADWRMDVDVHEQDQHNLQRPETVESLFYMWKLTGEEIYRHWGWEMFESFMQYTAVKGSGDKVYGFTSLSSVNLVPASKGGRDNMEGFWLAETLKYFWLLFGGNEDEMKDGLSLEKTVITTEAHFFPRFELGKVWKTGWERTNPKFGGGLLDGKTAEHSDEHGHDENGVEQAAANVKKNVQKLVRVIGEDLANGALDGLGKTDG